MKPVPFAPKYFASPDGRVFKSMRKGMRQLHVSPNKHGYLIVKMVLGVRPGKKRNSTSVTVHKVIAETFLGPRPPGTEVNHVDGVKLNCRVDNLEYATPKKNKEHAVRLGLGYAGEKNSNAKLTWEKVRAIRARTGDDSAALAAEFGVTRENINRVRRGVAWREPCAS